MTGALVFVDETLAELYDTKRVLVGVESNRLKFARTLKIDWREGKPVLHKWNLRKFMLLDFKCGGATDVKFLFGLGSGPGFGVLPSHENTIERSLRHFLEGGTKILQGSSVVDMDEHTLSDPPQRVIWLPDRVFVRQEGLLLSQKLHVLVVCPSYFQPKGLVLWPLAVTKVLRLYQIPLHMDTDLTNNGIFAPELSHGKIKDWPFRNCANLVIYASIFTQGWGVCVGGDAEGGDAEGDAAKGEDRASTELAGSGTPMENGIAETQTTASDVTKLLHRSEVESESSSLAESSSSTTSFLGSLSSLRMRKNDSTVADSTVGSTSSTTASFGSVPSLLARDNNSARDEYTVMTTSSVQS